MLPSLANVTRYSMATSINHRITWNAQIGHWYSKISDVKELARNQFEKEKEEFNGILHAPVRTKILSSYKVMPHDQMHRLKTPMFTPLRFVKAIASDQHNYAINIMFKGVHQLTLRPNMQISLIIQWTIFNGWMDFLSGGGGPGTAARIQDPHMGYIHTNVRTYVHTTYTHARTHARTHTHTHTYILMYRQANECSCTGRRIEIHVHV